MKEYVYPIIGISLIFICTTLGALFVFFIHKKEISPKLTKIFTGFAAGVMFSASFFLSSNGTFISTLSIACLALSIDFPSILIDSIVKVFMSRFGDNTSTSSPTLK